MDDSSGRPRPPTRRPNHDGFITIHYEGSHPGATPRPAGSVTPGIYILIWLIQIACFSPSPGTAARPDRPPARNRTLKNRASLAGKRGILGTELPPWQAT